MIVPHMRCSRQGSLVALPTPFRSGMLDTTALQGLIEWHIAQKSDGLVVAGTTGEAATLTDNERRGLFDAAVALRPRPHPDRRRRRDELHAHDGRDGARGR
ncbi:MAG: dihydrodipicolinate synthase family protein [Planctomycetes bacterium]|nr:dihydrodipicolinate synthase family protein [Planctomycetota bacterium]